MVVFRNVLLACVAAACLAPAAGLGGGVDDPEAHLTPFVTFLEEHGGDPHAFTMTALANHRLVIMGEIHHRPRYWAFNADLVRDPQFPKTVGAIYLELPSNDQPHIDAFFDSDPLEAGLVIRTLRDMLWMGWPDRAMLDFFITVWRVNHSLPPDQRIRVVLVDMPRPWERIRKREDWRPYEIDRDRCMADNILADLQRHPGEQRSGLFIVGAGHAMLNLEHADGKAPIRSAGWHLKRHLKPDAIFAFFPHAPAQTNSGRVQGRLRMGLFDSAFAALGRRPLALPLEVGPFGREPFDAFPDRRSIGTYGDGYDAYLYLGPLESESFSPLIRGFYTEEFVKEIDRRHRVTFGKSWAEVYGRALNPRSFVDWMAQSWGQPRRTWQPAALGPIDAWGRVSTD
ncbi:MAG: erythromycin esterase family protein [bacterium]|nr:erythromycin esterase family protein [bacterium]